MPKTSAELRLVTEYLRDTNNMRVLAKDLDHHVAASKACGYSFEKGTTLDWAVAALLIETFADVLDSMDV